MEFACFIPGILGSELRTTSGKTVWPPTWTEAIGSLKQWKLDALLSEEDLVSVGAVEEVCAKNIYRKLLETIEGSGFSRVGGSKRLAVLHYDWRLDIVDEIAPRLADELDKLVEAGGEEFHFVAHSMGGLVIRVLMQHPKYKDRVWRTGAKLMVTIATPFQGAPLALSRLLGLEGTSGIPAQTFGELRTKPRLRSPYQLMPPSGHPLIWTIRGGVVSTIDLYEVGGFGEQNGFVRGSLDSVGRLHAILDGEWPEHVNTFQFAGAGFETVTRLAEHEGIKSVRDDNSGDETVPLSSATSTLAPTMVLPGDHLGITSNRKLKLTLRALLGADDNAVIFTADGVEVIDDPDADLELQVSLPPLGVVARDGAVSAPGLLNWSHRLDDNQEVTVTTEGLQKNSNEVDEAAPKIVTTVSVNNGQIKQGFRIEGALSPGIYRVSAVMANGTADQTVLIVREQL